MTKKVTLLERLNEGMKVVDLPPGTLVKYKARGADLWAAKGYHPAGKFSSADGTKTDIRLFELIEVDPGEYMLYLGMEKVGARMMTTKREAGFAAATIFAHRFYYGEEMLYLIVERPDKYYSTFRRCFSRIDNKNNLCK